MAAVERFGVGQPLSDFIVRGDTIHFSGYVAEAAARGPVAEQTRDILARIDGSLPEAGSDNFIAATTRTTPKSVPLERVAERSAPHRRARSQRRP